MQVPSSTAVRSSRNGWKPALRLFGDFVDVNGSIKHDKDALDVTVYHHYGKCKVDVCCWRDEIARILCPSQQPSVQRILSSSLMNTLMTFLSFYKYWILLSLGHKMMHHWRLCILSGWYLAERKYGNVFNLWTGKASTKVRMSVWLITEATFGPAEWRGKGWGTVSSW